MLHISVGKAPCGLNQSDQFVQFLRRKTDMKGKCFSSRIPIFVVALIAIAGVLNCQMVIRAQDTVQDIKMETAIYGMVDDVELTLDVYKPAASNTPLPAVILIHGGAGSFGDRSVESDRAHGLAANGYVAFNIDYRLLDGGKNPWPAQLDDTQLAVRWIRANAQQYNVDPNRICSLGHSFGGQLAALLGVRDTSTDSKLALGEYSSRVACVVSIAGGLDAMHPYLDENVQAQMDLYGGAPSQTPAIHLDASPLAQVTADSAPFLIFHGADDENTSVEESRAMVDALHRAGVEVVYVEYPHATHFYWISFFKITGSWDLVAPETLAFLGRHLKAAI
jgi:acetyl esterase/lipase